MTRTFEEICQDKLEFSDEHPRPFVGEKIPAFYLPDHGDLKTEKQLQLENLKTLDLETSEKAKRIDRYARFWKTAGKFFDDSGRPTQLSTYVNFPYEAKNDIV